MSLNIVSKREAPVPPYQCEMIDISIEGIPFMLSALRLRSAKYWWLSADDQRIGRWLMYKESAAFLMPCSRAITNILEAQYNLLDATIRGTSRDVTGTGVDVDPFLYDPPIPQTVEPLEYLSPGLQYNSTESLYGVQNLANGTVTANYTDVRVFRQQLEDILAALSAETNEEIIAKLQQLIVLAGGI